MVTLFHRPASTSSVRALALLKQISATVGNNGSEGLAANHVTRSKLKRGEFELNVTDDAPTGDQLRSILEFVGARKASQLVKDARDEADAMKKLKENGDNFQRPVVGRHSTLKGKDRR